MFPRPVRNTAKCFQCVAVWLELHALKPNIQWKLMCQTLFMKAVLYTAYVRWDVFAI